jgi:hypothetical protein
MKEICRLIAVLAAPFLFASCGSTPDVIVVDSTGAPIVGAEVEPVSASINYKPAITDAKGQSRIRRSIQKVQWINVRKPGYSSQKSVDYSGPKPIRIVLTP